MTDSILALKATRLGKPKFPGITGMTGYSVEGKLRLLREQNYLLQMFMFFAVDDF